MCSNLILLSHSNSPSLHSGDNVFSFDEEPLPTAEELKEAILEAEGEHPQAVSSLDLSYDVLMPNASFKVVF